MAKTKDEILNSHINTLIQYANLTGRVDGVARVAATLTNVLEHKLDVWVAARFKDWPLEELIKYGEVIVEEREAASKVKPLVGSKRKN